MMFYVASLQCVICTNEWIGVYPVGTPEDCLECPSCGACDSKVLGWWSAKDMTYVAKQQPVWYE